MNIFSRGSEWRKWDLHVHSPASVLKNDFGDDWDKYVTTLFRTAIANDIRAIGITDYYLPEGYAILREQYLSNDKKLSTLFDSDEIARIKEIAVFPNIEFRLSKLVIGKQNDLIWNRKLNYHVILSDQISVAKLNSDFVSQIKFGFDAAIGSKVEQRPLTKENLIELGTRLITEHPKFADSGSPLWVGMLNASVDEEHLVEILNGNDHFRNKYLLGLPADEDLSDVHWNSQGHNLRKNLIKQAHFIFSSNPKTVKFLLGGETEAEQKEFVKEFGQIKPCIWGSDAHDVTKLFKPEKDRFTWIKADLTFEGLKQVIYDPKSRVRIQGISPEQKLGYQTIDAVRFIDKTTHKFFSNEWILLNAGLNTIIGGKSSGKSLLLYHIAKAINSVEVAEKTRLAKAANYNDLTDIDFEVRWSNGDISRSTDSASTKPITYVPQLYINHLAEAEGRSKLNELIREILKQNENFKIFDQNKELSIKEQNRLISAKIDELHELRDAFSANKKEIGNYAPRQAIEQEIAGLADKIKDLRVKSGFSKSEEDYYLNLKSRKNDLVNRREKLNRLSVEMAEIGSSITDRSEQITDDFVEDLLSDGLNNDGLASSKKIRMKLKSDLQATLTSFQQYMELRCAKIPHNINAVDKKLAAIEVTLVPLLQKITDHSTLQATTSLHEAEQKKLKEVLALEQKRKTLSEQGHACRATLFTLYEGLISLYNDYLSEVEKPEYQLSKDMTVSARVGFLEPKFNEFIRSFDGRGNFTYLLGDLKSEDGSIIFDRNSFAAVVNEIENKITRKFNVPTVRSGVSDRDLTKKLLNDFFFIDFVVRYREDDIVRMSPGKRGLVLLHLILHLSNASHPILIDQPEDNLDNRTIYNQLKDFIRDKKMLRQIIMVTHNANLVVASDSECVIVANQAGQTNNIDNKEFKFEYCSGSLEHSFENDSGESELLKKGIRQHVCEILEGGISAFKERELKYGFRI